MMNSATKNVNLSIDLVTILAIGVVSFIIKNVLHEALGHGGTCLLVGGRPLVLSSAHFDCDTAAVSDAGTHWISAGATLVNFAASYLSWLAFRNSSFWVRA